MPARIRSASAFVPTSKKTHDPLPVILAPSSPPTFPAPPIFPAFFPSASSASAHSAICGRKTHAAAAKSFQRESAIIADFNPLVNLDKFAPAS